jgi:uncharacterized SAM-dependent methyltransferase
MIINFLLLPSNKSIFQTFFVTDCHDFFSKKKSGNMGYWRYDDGNVDDPAAGSALWGRLVEQATTYYVSRAGDTSLDDHLKDISNYIQSDEVVLVDLGPGKLRQSKIDLIKTLVRNGVYAPVDLSHKFLSETESLKQKGILKAIFPVVADFTTENLSIPY